MVESADYDEATAAAVAIGSTSLIGTGLAKESGGNLDLHTGLLNGTAPGALIAGAGRTVGQEVAALIASGSPAGVAGGTPLLHGHNQLYSNSSQVVAASASFTPPNILFTKPSYIIRVTAQMSAVGSVSPSVKLNLQWRSSITGGTPNTDQQQWYIPAGATSSQRSNIKGPVVGDTLNITFTNTDAANSVTLGINVWEGTWAAARHDGRSQSNVNGSGFTALNNDNMAGIVANDSFTAAGASTTIKSLPLYCGQVNIWLNQNVAGGSQVSIVPTGDNSAGSNPIASLDWTAAPHQIVGVALPRAWCTAQFTNNAAGGQIATIGITALEFAS